MGTAVRMTEADRIALSEREARLDRLVEKWSRMPEIGKGLQTMKTWKARNLALYLENQARYIKSLTEAQYSSAFATAPENMIRLVRLAYPNSVRGEIFTDFAMETARDSIKYIKPVYSTNSNIRRSDLFGAAGTGFSDNPNADLGYQSGVTYESAQSRFPGEIANGSVSGTGPYSITFNSNEFTLGFLDGYTTIYDANKKPIAVQIAAGSWLFAPEAVGASITFDGVNTYTYTKGTSSATPAYATGRYNSEPDLTGTYLGEVELVMTDYQFRVRPLSLGVTWTILSELVLDSTVGVSAEETLLDAAAQEIKKALDFQAVRYAYHISQTNGITPVEFDAEAGAGTDDSYIHTAQTVTQAIEQVGNAIFSKINRGGVSRIVGGPSAATYLQLNAGFTNEGAQPRIGIHRIGTLNGIPVYKAPRGIVPDDTLLCVWKNDSVEADVSIAFGTLVPFYSTGAIPRKPLYKEAGIASFGDYKALNPTYIGTVKISNIRGAS